MAQPTAYEQFMLEMINRARFDPSAEAAQYGIDLNQGLAPGTLSSSAKQPLAFNLNLIDAARDHSQWMLNTDTFSHTGVGGSSAGDRMRTAGYRFTGSWTWGENIAWRGTTATPNIGAFVATQHGDLFKSVGHRTNLLNENFREVGVGILTGEFSGYNAVMTTQNFAKSGSSVFLTGVAFDDSVIDDDFYTVGEGLGGIQITATRQSDNAVFSTATFDSGGYQVALAPGTYQITFSGGELAQAVNQTITLANQNVKLDLATDQLPTNGGSNGSTTAATDIGEYGTLALNHQWQTVTLDKTYVNPVVIVSDPTLKGVDPVAIRLRNVTSGSFQIRLQEPQYKDGRHTNESVSYLVMEAGDWMLADGTRISAGTYASDRLTSQRFDSVDLTGFDTAPTVLAQVQTFNGNDWITTRTTAQSATGFQLAMQKEEALNKSLHPAETIGWLAIEQGIASDGDTLLQGGTTGRAYDHNRATVSLASGFDTAPALIAKLGSYYGSDTANLRLEAITSTSFGVGVYEEQSLDAELSHTQETVAFLALAGKAGVLSGLSV
ncbi:CAP domain-containing protein [Almyronema epifaneia]|uniref:CAP domain-containing protein n=1 Tax=Almyronema epifaneia S1 TaxID=2991925 RepID=A0ABW6ICG3_9CYAN